MFWFGAAVSAALCLFLLWAAGAWGAANRRWDEEERQQRADDAREVRRRHAEVGLHDGDTKGQRCIPCGIG